LPQSGFIVKDLPFNANFHSYFLLGFSPFSYLFIQLQLAQRI